MKPSSLNSPLELRVGSTGAGVFVGCGAGVGLVTPVSLHSIPVLGQLAASLSSSLAGLNSATGGVFGAARGRVRALGVRGLDAGFGCGVMLGYGYGAGLFLKPTALQSLGVSLQAAGQRVLARLPQPVQAAVREQQQRQARPGALAATSSSSAWQGAASLQGSVAAPSLPQPPDAPPAQPAAGSQQAGQSADGAAMRQADDLAELSRLVVKQQNQLGELQQQVATLQAAVCKLDAKAPGCKR